MFGFKFSDRLFSFRSVEEVLSDTAAGYISVFPGTRKSPSKTPLLSMLKSVGENTETMAELLADGNVSRLQKYYSSRVTG